jgi:phosphoglycerol transferase MdoB-like AlkP superfamily enzyme
MKNGLQADDLARFVRKVSKRWAVCLCFLLFAATSVALVWRYDPAFAAGINASLLWRNALPVALLALLVFSLSGRGLFTVMVVGGFTWLVFAVNAIKELNMNEPLLPGDLVLRHQLLHNLDFFAHYTGHRFVVLLKLLLLLVIAIGVWRLERHWWRPSWAVRAGCLLLALSSLVTLYRGDTFWHRVYADEALPGFQLWDPVASVHKVGLMAGLVRMSQESKVAIPKPDRTLVKQFAKDHSAELAKRSARVAPLNLPDIVVVQSEAFFDPGVLKGIDMGEFAPNFERLSATGISGSLATPAYGGGTIRTEFETLTGYPMLAFPSIVYPYYGLAAEWMPSVPHRLDSLGYSSTLFHPFRSGFWNRTQVMPLLGFQRSYYEKDFKGAERAGFYISDHALFDFVLDHLDDGGSGPKYSMIITMENHGPWMHDAGSLADVLKGKSLPPGMSADAKEEMTYYLSHLVNGDQALGDFAKRLLARPRWTVLLFYGDHLPALPHAFSEVAFDDGEASTAQHTRYMLISNRPLQPQTLNLNAYDLPGLLFDTVGLPEDGYLAMSSVIRQAWQRDHFDNGPSYGQVSFNAARLEVSCRRRITLNGKCKRRLIPAAQVANAN